MAGKRRKASPAFTQSNLSLLGDLEGIVDLDSEIPDRALQLCVSKKEVNGSQILRPSINEGRLGPPNRVRSVRRGIKADLLHPTIYDAGILPSAEMRRRVQPTWEQVVSLDVV